MNKIKDPFENMNKEESLAFIKNNKDFFFHPKMVPGLKAIFNDKTVVIEVLKNNGLFLRYAHESFKNDPEIVLEAVKQCGISLSYASSNLKSNIDIVTAAVKSHPHALMYASDKLKENKELCLKSVTADGSCLAYVPSELTKDKDIVRAALTNNALSLMYVHSSLKEDRDLVKISVDKDPSALSYISEKLQYDKALFLETLEHPQVNALQTYRLSAYPLKDDKEFTLAFLKKDGLCLESVSLRLSDDYDIVQAAVNQHPLSLFHASERLQNHIDFLSVIKDLPVPPNYEPWYNERMKILAILEDEQWMRENSPVSTTQYKKRKF